MYQDISNEYYLMRCYFEPRIGKKKKRKTSIE